MSALSSREFVPEIGQGRHRRILFICPIDPSFGRTGEYIRIRNLLSTIGVAAALRGHFASASLVIGMHNVQPEITMAAANGPFTPLWI